MLHALNHLQGPSLDSRQYVLVALVLGSPELDTDVRSHQCWVVRILYMVPWTGPF